MANAIALFRERGYDAAPVRELAEASLASEATFYNYFGSKDALLGEWLHDRVEAALEERLQPERPLRPALRAAAAELGSWLDEQGALGRLAAERCRVAARPGAPGRPVASGWRARIAAAREAGELRRDLPLEELCAALVAALLGALCACCGDSREGGEGSTAERLARAVDLVADGARRRHERVSLAAPRPRAAPPA